MTKNERAKEYSKSHDGDLTHVEEGLMYAGYVDGWEACEDNREQQQFIEWLETQPDYKNLYQEWKFQKDNV